MRSFLFFFSFKYRRRFGRTISEVYEVYWNYSFNPFSTSTCNCENRVLVSVSGSNITIKNVVYLKRDSELHMRSIQLSSTMLEVKNKISFTPISLSVSRISKLDRCILEAIEKSWRQRKNKNNSWGFNDLAHVPCDSFIAS